MSSEKSAPFKSPPFDGEHGFKRMCERTREARDHEADRLFGADNLNAVLSAAAAQGQSSAVFSPSVPMDLSDTATAKAVQKMLVEAGFLAEWKTSRSSPDAEPHTVLRVSWGVDATRGAAS